MTVAAITKHDVADYLSTLINVYVAVDHRLHRHDADLLVRRPSPLQPLANAILSFLRDVSEPYLRIFRRFIPPIGPLDISPIVAILVLQIGGGIIVGLIRG